MTTCSGCGASGQPEGARFCFSCGLDLQGARCSSCDAEIVAGARFCSSCGAVQATGAAAPPGAQPVASRRITSVLFGDLVGFTSLSESRDQEDVRELLSRYFDECRQIIARYGGTVEKFIGDAVMAVWGVPTSHEDDAERAVRAGLELVNRIESLGLDVGVPDLAMRVGIVTGEVAVTVGAEQQGMVAGDAVNTAARVQSAAAPGQVWVDETTKLLTTSAISYVDVGSHDMKGKADPVPLWSVRAVVAAVGGAQRADGLEAPHVGRDRELRLAKELFHAVEESGRPSLIVVEGEPGVGKTRLGWEFFKYIDGLQTSVRWHSGRCLSYGEGVAFYALAEAIRGRLQILRADDDAVGTADEDQSRLLALGLDTYVPDPEEQAWLEPRLGALLGIGAVTTFPREDLFNAWATFLHRVSEDDHPVTLLIDDAQHADDGLLMFLEHLLAVGSFPCFVALLTRPGLLEEHPDLATNRRTTVLHLEALPDRDMGALVDALVVGLPEGARGSLVQRAEGIPLFAVETVRSLIDRDLVIPRGGQYVLADPDRLDLDGIGAPASLQALISARLDTLSPELRRVIDQASVVGSSFTRDVIARLCPDATDLDASLAALVRLQLLRQESDRFSADRGRYQFVQSGVRQVAYGTLSRRDRKASHLAMVELMGEWDNSAGEISGVIAQHLLEALDAVPEATDHDDLAAAAVDHLLRAAERATALGAPSEAAGHLALALGRCVDEVAAATIERDLAMELIRSGDHVSALGHAESAVETLERHGETTLAGSAAAVAADAIVAAGDYDRAFELAEPWYRRVCAAADSPRTELELHVVMVRAKIRGGGDVLELAHEQARLAEFIGDTSAIVDSYLSLSVHYGRNGPRGLGFVLLESAANLARENHESRQLSRALLNLNADLTQDDAKRAVQFGSEAVSVARSVGDAPWTSVATCNLVLAQMVHGDWDEALACDEELFVDLEIPVFELVRCHTLLCRGQSWAPSEGFHRGGDEQDEGIAAFRVAVDARTALAERDPRAASTALSALRMIHSVTNVYDDFTVLFLIATDVAWEMGDREALEEMMALVDLRTRERLPRGLLAQHTRLRALLAAQDEEEPDEVERLFRTALAHAEGWNSRPTVARIHADLGTWLIGQGRADEAAASLAVAREEFERLGAVAWTEQLDRRLAGVAI